MRTNNGSAFWPFFFLPSNSLQLRNLPGFSQRMPFMERGPSVSKGPFTTRMTQWRRSLAQESVKRITPNRDMFRASQIKTRVPITLLEKHKLDRVLRCNFFFWDYGNSISKRWENDRFCLALNRTFSWRWLWRSKKGPTESKKLCFSFTLPMANGAGGNGVLTK